MSDIDFKKIKELNDEIEKLLNERPEYREFQEEIRKEIKKGLTTNNRMNIAFGLMIESARKLGKEMESFSDLLKGEKE